MLAAAQAEPLRLVARTPILAGAAQRISRLQKYPWSTQVARAAGHAGTGARTLRPLNERGRVPHMFNIPITPDEPTHEQQRALREIYNWLRLQGKWPVFAQIDKVLDRAGIQLQDISLEFPRGLSSLGHRWMMDNDELSLQPEALPYCRPESIDDCDLVLRIVWHAIERERAHEPIEGAPMPNVTGAELTRLLGFPESRLLRVYYLLQFDYWLGGSGVTVDGHFNMYVSRTIRKFRGIQTYANYLDIRAQIRAEAHNRSPYRTTQPQAADVDETDSVESSHVSPQSAIVVPGPPATAQTTVPNRDVEEEEEEEEEDIAVDVELDARPTALSELRTILNKFASVAHRLRNRHAGKPGFEIDDEYDVQDLLYALLHIYFSDVRREEHSPSYGGTSSRADFLVQPHGLIVEVKKTSAQRNRGNRQISDELIIDKERYAKLAGVTRLFCLIYDPDHVITNPAGLETDLSQTDGLPTEVFVRPYL
jgi:hypothetical protein